jgi:hypothetical protein
MRFAKRWAIIPVAVSLAISTGCRERVAGATEISDPKATTAAAAPASLAAAPTPLDAFRGPQGAEVSASENAGRYLLSITSEQIQEYSYSIYGVADFKPAASYCLLSYQVDGLSSKAIVLDKDSKEIAAIAASGQQAPAQLAFKATAHAPYRLVFYKTERISIPVVYRDIELKCIDAANADLAAKIHPAFGTLAATEFASERLKAAASMDGAALQRLKARFTLTGKVAREKSIDADNPYSMANFLFSEFRSAQADMREAYPQLSDDQRWPFYAMNIAHFAVPLTRQAEETPRNILRSGGGTCWQQAQVGAYFYDLSGEVRRARIISSDPPVLGHAFFAGASFIADVTNNILLPVSAKQWNAMSPAERMDVLKNKAVYGINLDVWHGQARPESLAIAPQSELDFGYVDTIQRLPLALLTDPRTIPFDPAAQSAPAP